MTDRIQEARAKLRAELRHRFPIGYGDFLFAVEALMDAKIDSRHESPPAPQAASGEGSAGGLNTPALLAARQLLSEINWYSTEHSHEAVAVEGKVADALERFVRAFVLATWEAKLIAWDLTRPSDAVDAQVLEVSCDGYGYVPTQFFQALTPAMDALEAFEGGGICAARVRRWAPAGPEKCGPDEERESAIDVQGADLRRAMEKLAAVEAELDALRTQADDASVLLENERMQHDETRGYRQHAEQARDALRRKLETFWPIILGALETYSKECYATSLRVAVEEFPVAAEEPHVRPQLITAAFAEDTWVRDK